MHTIIQPERSASSAAPRRAGENAAEKAAAKVAVAGATGYAGQELVRLLARHPSVTITAAMSSASAPSALRRDGSGPAAAVRQLPALARLWDGAVQPLSHEALREADLVFLALPDSAAAELGPMLAAAGVRVIDLSGAFRLRDREARARWYPETKQMPERVAYGLTERERANVRDAQLVANPGCYPTSALLALAPLMEAGLVSPTSDVIVDSKSGVSGAGKTPSERTHFSEVHGSLSAYGVFNHRHGAEMEQGLGREVTFTPHLVPLDRGILSTIYVRVPAGTTEAAIGDVLTSAYANETFVRLTGSALPEIKHVAHTNFCDIGWRVEAAGGSGSTARAILVSSIDNLVKGAAGQAVQNMNVMLGFEEASGLL